MCEVLVLTRQPPLVLLQCPRHYPRETYALLELVGRLRLVHNGGKAELRLGEDRKFLEELRNRCMTVDLPLFFFIE